MAIGTGWKRLHVAMLVLFGAWAAGWLVASSWALIVKEYGLVAIYLAVGLLPLLAYLLVAWVIAGFLGDRNSEPQ